jgi:hypothetical protein
MEQIRLNALYQNLSYNYSYNTEYLSWFTGKPTGGIMPYTTKQRTRRQRQRRKAGQVKRFEIVLSADNERDRDLYDFLTQLPRGEVSEFIKSAVVEKIQRHNDPVPATPDPAEQLNAILAELAVVKKAVTAPPARNVAAVPPASPDPAPELTLSSGLDMSRPRPKRPTTAPAPPPTLPEEKPFDEATARRMLVDSINNFGKNRSGG